MSLPVDRHLDFDRPLSRPHASDPRGNLLCVQCGESWLYVIKRGGAWVVSCWLLPRSLQNAIADALYEDERINYIGFDWETSLKVFDSRIGKPVIVGVGAGESHIFWRSIQPITSIDWVHHEEAEFTPIDLQIEEVES